MIKIKIKKGQDPIEVCNSLLRNPNVLYAEPIVMDRPLYSPSDPFTTSQYYLDNIQAYDAWDITRGDDDITIAIIDTGVDLDHEDLASNLWTNEADPIDGVDNDENGYVDDFWGYDFADDDSDPEADQNDHGARVAGIAGASTDNGVGMAGVGFNTKIAALKGFRSEDGLSNGLFDAILYAADNGIQVLNLSWGSIREPLQSEQDIINYAVLERDVIIVAAAGNDGTKTTAEEKFYPASYENVLSIGGSDEGDNKWSGSSYNYAVDLIAPASTILSTTTGDGYNSSGGFGTSFASPMVAAAAALVKDQFPGLNAQQIMERVRVTADDIYDVGSNISFDGKLGKGRLNVYRAVAESDL
ncbi:MAG: S8 family serine peptidase, partial [Bacteroidota bacterium]